MIKKYDELVLDIFKGLFIVNHEGNFFAVPTVFGDDEKVEALMVSRIGDIDRIKLPMVSLCDGNAEVISKNDIIFGDNTLIIAFSYSLSLWTLYKEDQSQLLEQIISKFTPTIHVKPGVLSLKSISRDCEIIAPHIERTKLEMVYVTDMPMTIKESHL